MEARNILIYLSLKYDGDWNKIYNAIKTKENVDKDAVEKCIEKIKCKAVTLIDDNYPSILKEISNPPFVIFYYGDLTLISDYKKNLAVVGSREPDLYGIKCINKLISQVCEKINIVSGLAKGIDIEAHKTSIRNKGRTVAVLGCGIDNCYPKENLSFYNEIKQNHLLLSEYPNTVMPDKDNFPKRNRIIVGLSKAVLIGEGKERSGTSISANYAAMFNREVLSIPGDIDNELCSLNNSLIKMGANVVLSSNDILEIF